MPRPHDEFEDTSLRRRVAAAPADREAIREIAIATAPEFVARRLPDAVRPPPGATRVAGREATRALALTLRDEDAGRLVAFDGAGAPELASHTDINPSREPT